MGAQKAAHMVCSPTGANLFNKETDHRASHYLLEKLKVDYERSGSQMVFIVGGINKGQGLGNLIRFKGYDADPRHFRIIGFDIASINVKTVRQKFVSHKDMEF